MNVPNLRDPSIALRVAIIALGALSLIFLIAGTAVDEYITDKQGTTIGCQKLYMDKFAFRGPFKYMNTLSFIIIFTTSVLCFIQAAAVAFNVIVLMQGKNQKLALILTSVVTVLLLVVIVMASVNFSFRNISPQATEMKRSPERLEAALAYAANQADKALNNIGNEIRKGANDAGRELENALGNYRRKRRVPGRPLAPRTPRKPLSRLIEDELPLTPPWGATFGLVCTAFVFSIINLILLLAIWTMAKSGASTIGGHFDYVKTSVLAFVRSPVKVVRVAITVVNVLIFTLMWTCVVIDKYVDRNDTMAYCATGTRLRDCNYPKLGYNAKFKDMHTLSIVLLVLTSLVSAAMFVACVLCVLQLVKGKIFVLPLLGLSACTTLFMLISVVLACLDFTSASYYPNEGNIAVFKISFHLLATSLAWGFINTGLNVFHMILFKRGGVLGTSLLATSSNLPSSQPPSSGPTPSSK